MAGLCATAHVVHRSPSTVTTLPTSQLHYPHKLPPHLIAPRNSALSSVVVILKVYFFVRAFSLHVARLFRKLMADAKDVAARAWQVRARRLEAALSMLKSKGLELSMPDQEKVSMLNAGGAARRGGMALDATRDTARASSLPLIDSPEYVTESSRELWQKAKDRLFADGKFLGTHLAAVSSPSFRSSSCSMTLRWIICPPEAEPRSRWSKETRSWSSATAEWRAGDADKAPTREPVNAPKRQSLQTAENDVCAEPLLRLKAVPTWLLAQPSHMSHKGQLG